MKKAVSAVIICLLVFSLAACTGKKDRPDIVGIYELVSMQAKDNSVTDEDLASLKAMGMVATLEIKDDGTAVMDAFGERIDFTYDLDKMTFTSDGQSSAFSYEDGKITFSHEGESMTFLRLESVSFSDLS